MNIFVKGHKTNLMKTFDMQTLSHQTYQILLIHIILRGVACESSKGKNLLNNFTTLSFKLQSEM